VVATVDVCFVGQSGNDVEAPTFPFLAHRVDIEMSAFPPLLVA
jgi:hypothetical protein